MAEDWTKFREKLGSKHFSPHESDWVAMKDLIEKQPRLAKEPVQWLGTKSILIAGLAFIMGGLSVYFVSSKEQGRSTPVIEQIPGDSEKTILRVDESHSPKPYHELINETPGRVSRISLQESQPGEASGMVADSGKVTSTNPVLSPLPARTSAKSKRLNSGDGEKVHDELVSTENNILKGRDLSGQPFFRPSAIDREEDRLIEFLLVDPKNKNPLLNRQPSSSIQKSNVAVLPNKNALFKVSSVSIVGTFGLPAKNAGYNIGAGVDLTLQHRNFTINTGIYVNNSKRFYHDSILKTFVTSQYLQQVDSTWVIDGPFQGHYIYDTTEVAVHDTTSFYQRNAVKSKISFRYYELPVYLGYRYSVNRWNFDIAAGLILNWRKLDNSEGEINKGAVGFDGAFRPSATYYLNEDWGITTRLGYRFNLYRPDEFRVTHQKPDQWFLQAGISYNW